MQCLLGGGGGGGGGGKFPGPLEPRPRPASPQLVACSPPGRYEQPKFFGAQTVIKNHSAGFSIEITCGFR